VRFTLKVLVSGGPDSSIISCASERSCKETVAQLE